MGRGGEEQHVSGTGVCAAAEAIPNARFSVGDEEPPGGSQLRSDMVSPHLSLR